MMNIQEKEILRFLYGKTFESQRALALDTGFSLGSVNIALKGLIKNGYLSENYFLTAKSHKLFEYNKPVHAVILAAGMGGRMLPLHSGEPKGLLKLRGNTLIERLIMQLHEAGVYDIDIVTGFLKERYEFLIDEYKVNLIYNPDYGNKNNMHSLNKVINKMKGSYIIPCDVWCEENPFSNCELYSWYMVSDEEQAPGIVRVNKKHQLVSVKEGQAGNTMIGIAYITQEGAEELKKQVKRCCNNKKYDHVFWEEVLFGMSREPVYAKIVSRDKVFEINTYEQLQELNECSKQLDDDSIKLMSDVLQVEAQDIIKIRALKKGMTNRSYLFECRGETYIMRIPGAGTKKLINRQQEYEVYKTVKGLELSDDIIYISEKSGWKISRYWNDARVCDPYNQQDVEACMRRLKEFHGWELKVEHSFDLFEKISFYESLWTEPSVYKDFQIIKERIFGLKAFLAHLPKKWGLTHIDAVPDNFLFVGQDIRLIDWEYAGMQDVHVDIAMFAIYAMYDRQHIDDLIDVYFQYQCPKLVRIKIYAYIAVCGFLWSNWSEYKRQCGIEFGEYAMNQYRFAKEYSLITADELENLRGAKVDNAVILAAGMSSRFAPLSEEIPKGLLKVRGEVLIERQICQLRAAGIEEIIIVIGYKKESFYYLQEKYGVILIENKDYQLRNNHSSLYYVREYLKNTYICSADHYFLRNIFEPYGEEACYAGVFEPGRTLEWCLKTDGADYITGVFIGGEHSWIMRGYAYFTKVFSDIFRKKLEEAWDRPETRKLYWEDIYMQNIKELPMKLKRYKETEIVEFDTLEELRSFDESYKINSGSMILNIITGRLGCSEEEITGIRPIKDNQGVVGFEFTCKEKNYQYIYKRGEVYEK